MTPGRWVLLAVAVALLLSGQFQPVAAAPSLTSVTPSTVTDQDTFTYTLAGNNFDCAYPTTPTVSGIFYFVSSTCNSSTSITYTGNYSLNNSTNTSSSVTVSDGTGTSNSKTVTVQPYPTPSISSVTPSSNINTSSTTSLTITGSGFYTTNATCPVVAYLDYGTGQQVSLTVTSSSATSISATVQANTVTSGSHQLSVFNRIWQGSVCSNFRQSNKVAITFISSPTITSLSPTSATAGGGPFTLTVNGANYVNPTTVNWNGSARTTTFVSSTQVTASIPASDIATAGTATVTVSNANGTSSGATFTINNPLPALTSVSPSSTTAPGSAFTLTATGSNFVSSSVVRWNGSNRTTTYVSPTQLSASIPASDVASAGTATVTVFNPTPGGGTSGGQTFTVNNPAPATTAISPTFVPPGNPAFTLTVTGSNFVNGSTVQWNGASRTTTYVSATQLTASIPASDVAAAGTADVTVVNAAPGGGTSNAQTFTIAYPLPTLTSLSPPSIPMGSGDLTVTLTGTGFYSGASTVQWNGTSLATTYIDATHLSAVIPAANLAAPDTVAITVANASPGGGVSNGLSFVVIPTIQIGAQAQDGWNVTVPVTWPASATVTNHSVDCGTTPSQVLAGPTVSCVYTKAGTYTIAGTSTVGGTAGVQSPAQAVTIQLLVPTAATLTPSIDGRLAVPGTDTYTLPVPLSVAVALTRPGGVGIVDPLNLGASTVKVQLGTGTPVTATTTSVDPLTYTATRSLTDAGTYTITLTGFTASGAAVTASVTTTLTLSTVTLAVGALQQDGWNVDAPVSWPAGAAPISVDCGTTTTQTFTGPSGTCVYTKAGTYSVIGRYTEPYHGATVQTPPATVTIPLLVPTAATISATVNGLQVAADGTVAPFRFPAALSAAIALVRPDGVGIVDPLNTNVSRLAITPEGGTTANRFINPGSDPLHTTASGQLDTPATYTLQLNGQTVSGGPVTGSLTLIVSQGTPVLILGDLIQDGFTVTMTVAWPADLQGAVPLSINCGTPSTQLVTGTAGVCRYAAAGTFQVRGSYKSPEDGAPTLWTALQPVTIPSRVPTGADLAFAVNGVPVTGSSITAYRFPAVVKTTTTLQLPPQVGIIDPLDLGQSRLVTGPSGGTQTAYQLRSGDDPTINTVLSSLDAPGDYTVTLNGKTVGGVTITATRTVSVAAANISLILGDLVQDGDQVAVSVTWPDGVSPVSVNCGTPFTQTFTGPSGACSYGRQGAYTITGTFVNPEDNTKIQSAPATVTIPGITPTDVQISLQVNGQPAAGSVSVYRLPAILKAIITMQRPAGIGVLDRLDPQNSTVSVAPDGMAPTRYHPVLRDDPLLATADAELRRVGPHTITLQGKTLGGQVLTASASLTVDLGKVTLLVDPPAQDGDAVVVRVSWPDGAPTGTITCGFMNQRITTQSGACRYTRAGSYQILGVFPDPARGATVLTDPVPVTIPLLEPINPSLSVASINSAGLSADTSGTVPVFTTTQPQSYPVTVRLTLAFQRPDGIGVLDVIDRSHSSLTATAAGEGASPIPIAIKPGNGPLELTAFATLRSFPPDPATPGQWRYRFAFTGQSMGGTQYSAQADLVGSIGGASPMTLEVSRTAPTVPYAPATYRYWLKSAHGATLAEPVAPTWTVTADGQAPGQTVRNTGMAVTFQGPGTYQVRLTVTAPFSGTATWSDTVTVPVLPDVPTATITTSAPRYNRPPADYRFSVAVPRLPDPRERPGTPTWTVDSTNVTGPVLVTTFTTAGEHQIGVSVPTSYGRTIEGQTTVTVNPNQPPVGSIDCSRSNYRSLTKKYILYCRATAADPDGRITRLRWAVPELQYERLDTTIMVLERAEPAAVTVELHISDNSGDETVVSIPIDMTHLPVL